MRGSGSESTIGDKLLEAVFVETQQAELQDKTEYVTELYNDGKLSLDEYLDEIENINTLHSPLEMRRQGLVDKINAEQARRIGMLRKISRFLFRR